MKNFKQSNLLFINTNRKTNIHVNKFTKATINTYIKKNPILGGGNGME